MAMAALLSAPAPAQPSQSQNQNQTTTRAQTVSSSPHIQHVLVRGTGAALEVEIQTSGGPVAPDTQAIADPDRIVVDFPGALPSAELRALQVNRGALKRVRTGLFFRDPPITRVVLDLAEPQSYRIETIGKAIVVKLGPIDSNEKNPPAVADARNANVSKASVSRVSVTSVPAAKLQNASLASAASIAPAKIAPARISDAVSPAPATALPAVAPIVTPTGANAAPLQPAVSVTYVSGMLRIRAEKATLARILFEVQRQTQAEIAIPAGAEQEEVVADLGPAPAREVLAALLNGSPYNFIFVGNEQALERVILTRRDSQ
jgi:AMIN domain